MSDWRRIDIDAYDPESGRLNREDLIPSYPNQITLQDLQPTISQLRSFANSGDINSAIQLATSDVPYNTDEQTKLQYVYAVLEVLVQVRQADVINIIKGLNSQQQDSLAKFLYKGMSMPEGQKNGGILLSWFEKLTQVAGVTPIVHYLSDRRTV
ncbi:hypothetical protein KAFR_0L00990 [Kazachstania africana CBS 2517]|uniref:Actin-related protein 2/3 complex subunit 5 n=1 Tax=Kazachstania africana (strain ATCC 22294 / BCRC 22015 / CBS 2517 / CECT 1963 / NBRC 1671 / NRRL Y-8276) TaxID=1071382 RepID=H2B257_KAZAF|nr:hypothetical protein KAFR_0L00990 [Kazachstania africana CBS 2517]CCF60707.1 hypothetical protein KAFR_0L00990 [Kazachstania africana CBS 2517]